MPASKIDLSPHNARAYLEPGPIVLISSRHGDETNIMTLGWHVVLEFSPSLVGCMISGGNHSFRLVRQSRECVINLPTVDMIDTVVRIGNSSGRSVDKFADNALTAEPALRVEAPLIGECYANFECRLFDDAMVDRYNFFIFEIVKAHRARRPKHPQTIHYTGDGDFMVAGKIVSRRGLFRPGMLGNGRS
ncbi:flavin reductase family protein [Sphingobium nicotianae]|uniref:Flavin reductase family protein n=1 Tax=Sphingobium nicotianae TaxID=2782607 RepID=A0A9X1AJW8_9SPHN|nr:flavin reductase family protein [Sphingobium nicotianae]MBT2185878.1 flavin reductase family protein [Sphingobium nicotianae]